MATRGTPIPAATVQQLKRLVPVLGIRGAAREAGVDRNTSRKYAGRLAADPRAKRDR